MGVRSVVGGGPRAEEEGLQYDRVRRMVMTLA